MDKLISAWPYVATFLGTNIAYMLVLPHTHGWTNLIPSIALACLGALLTWLWPVMLSKGVNLMVIGPLIGALLPLLGIVVGYFVLKETASFQKISLLLLATGIIAYASR